MIDVAPPGGRGGHEVVLTKTFEHAGAPWFEMMDSNRGPDRRLYVSAAELDTILQENGVTIRPERGTTPSLLRPADAK
jgi:hypothetical protein